MRKDTFFDNWKPVIFYLVIWLISYSAFFLFCPGGEMDYWILIFWIIIPLVTVITAYKLGKNDRWSMLQMSLFTFFYGVMYMLIRYITFGHHGVGLEWHLLLIGAILFLAGFVTGRGTIKN